MPSSKLQLSKVTLVAMTSVHVRETIKAMQYSMRGIEFAEAVLITHRRPLFLPKGIIYRYIDKLDTIDRFNFETVYHLGNYVDTEFALLVHYDGFVVNPSSWQDAFMQYDYIGSPWPLPKQGDDTTYRDIHGNLCRVGNSVSLRSKRLMDFFKEQKIPWTPQKGWYNEDGFICCRNRHLLEEAGMRIAPLELAIFFGHENMLPETAGIDPFVFHKWDGTNAKYPDFRPKGKAVIFMQRVVRKIGKIIRPGKR